jgi:hypothetical protein
VNNGVAALDKPVDSFFVRQIATHGFFSFAGLERGDVGQPHRPRIWLECVPQHRSQAAGSAGK